MKKYSLFLGFLPFLSFLFLLISFIFLPNNLFAIESFSCPNGKIIRQGDSLVEVLKLCSRNQLDNKGYLVSRPSVISWEKLTQEVTYNKDHQVIDKKKVLKKHAIVLFLDTNNQKVEAFEFLNGQLIGKVDLNKLEN